MPSEVTLVEWDELAGIDNGTFTAYKSAERLRRDVFARYGYDRDASDFVGAELGCLRDHLHGRQDARKTVGRAS